jgi:hypothetical protein
MRVMTVIFDKETRILNNLRRFMTLLLLLMFMRDSLRFADIFHSMSIRISPFFIIKRNANKFIIMKSQDNCWTQTISHVSFISSNLKLHAIFIRKSSAQSHKIRKGKTHFKLHLQRATFTQKNQINLAVN